MSSKKKGNPAEGFALELPPPPARTAVPDEAAARFVGEAMPRPPPASTRRATPVPPPMAVAPAEEILRPPAPQAAPPPEAPPAPPKASPVPSPPTSSGPAEIEPMPGGRRVRVRKTDGVPMRRTTVWLKATMAKRLALFCAAREASQTDVIDAALAAYLERHGGLAACRHDIQIARRGWAAERAGHSSGRQSRGHRGPRRAHGNRTRAHDDPEVGSPWALRWGHSDLQTAQGERYKETLRERHTARRRAGTHAHMHARTYARERRRAMSRPGFEELRAISKSKLSSKEKHLLMVLVLHANDEGTCYPRISTLAAETGASESTVKRTLEALEIKGLIQRRQRRSATGDPTSNLYTLTLDVFMNNVSHGYYDARRAKAFGGLRRAYGAAVAEGLRSKKKRAYTSARLGNNEGKALEQIADMKLHLGDKPAEWTRVVSAFASSLRADGRPSDAAATSPTKCLAWIEWHVARNREAKEAKEQPAGGAQEPDGEEGDGGRSASPSAIQDAPQNKAS